MKQLAVYLVYSTLTSSGSTLFFFYLSNLRVPLGLLVIRALRGLRGDQVIQASKDQRGRKVTVAVAASSVLKDMW